MLAEILILLVPHIFKLPSQYSGPSFHNTIIATLLEKVVRKSGQRS